MKNRRAVVAVSGGVDSLASMLLLKQEGYEVIALHAALADHPAMEREAVAAGLSEACKKLGVFLECVDMREVFSEEIVKPYIAALCAGKTPNPCIACNRKIKFGRLLEIAREMGGDHFATGHYAALKAGPYGAKPMFGPARDQHKDQSYFLAHVRPKSLGHLLFPCAKYLKSEICSFVKNAGLSVPQSVESQDACFLDSQLQKNIQTKMGAAQSAGKIILKLPDGSRKEAGCHSGLWRFTRGQRRGLGIPGPEPWHVLEKNFETGELIIGPRSLLAMKACRASKPNFFVSPEKWPEKLWIKTRYRQAAIPASVSVSDDALDAVPENPVFPGAEGQTLAVYDAFGNLLAGAIIEEVFMAG